MKKKLQKLIKELEAEKRQWQKDYTECPPDLESFYNGMNMAIGVCITKLNKILNEAPVCGSNE